MIATCRRAAASAHELSMSSGSPRSGTRWIRSTTRSGRGTGGCPQLNAARTATKAYSRCTGVNWATIGTSPSRRTPAGCSCIRTNTVRAGSTCITRSRARTRKGSHMSRSTAGLSLPCIAAERTASRLIVDGDARTAAGRYGRRVSSYGAPCSSPSGYNPTEPWSCGQPWGRVQGTRASDGEGDEVPASAPASPAGTGHGHRVGGRYPG